MELLIIGKLRNSQETRLKVSLLFRVFVFLGFVILVETSFGQDLPNTAYDTYSLANDYKSREFVDEILSELKNSKKGSLEEAHYFSQLSFFYRGLNITDSANYYKNRAGGFWDETPVTDQNKDLFGQYLLLKIGYTPLVGNELSILDSAAQYITNPLDKQHIQGIRWIKTSLILDKEGYARQWNELMDTEGLSEKLKGLLMSLHALNVFSIVQNADSAVVLGSAAKELNTSIFTGQMASAAISLGNMAQGRRFEAKKEMLSMKRALDEAEIPLTTNMALYYNHSMQDYYFRAMQYDSAIHYLLNIVEAYKESSQPLLIANNYYNISLYYTRLDDFESAEEYILKALDPKILTDLESNPEILVRFTNQLLEIWLSAYHNTSDEAKRKSLLQKLEERIALQEGYVAKTKSVWRLMRFRYAKGRYLTITKDYKFAELEIKAVIAFAEERKARRWISDGNLYLGQLYLRSGRVSEAITFFEELYMVKGRSTSKEHSEALEFLIECSILLGRSEDALIYLGRLKKVENDLTNQKADLLLSQYKVTEELEKERMTNENLELERNTQISLLARQRQLIGVSVLGLVLLSFVLVRLRMILKRNKALLVEVQHEREELQNTNSELENVVYSLEGGQQGQQELLNKLSGHLSRLFNGIKGIRSIIPEVGKLNSEQSRYLDRISQLTAREEHSLNDLISLNSIVSDHNISITRVAISDLLIAVKNSCASNLKIHSASLNTEMSEGLVFLGDKELLEMVFISLIEHGLQQPLEKEKLELEIDSEDGLKVTFSFRSAPVPKETIDQWLSPGPANLKGYLSKVSQLKDMMDGTMQYLISGDTHKITIKLNLVELKVAKNKSVEIDQLEVDRIYEMVVNFLITEKGFQDSNLTLMSLSKKLNLSGRRISSAINAREKTNFSKFLSRLRIEEVKTILAEGNFMHLNIAGIGYEAGFNSKSTFFAAFKEFVGCTPGEYMNSISEKDMNKYEFVSSN